MYVIFVVQFGPVLLTILFIYKEIHHDMKRRMESAKRWLDSKSPVKKERQKKSPSSPPILEAPARKKTNSSPIILSLTDPTYKETMHKYFRQMGNKTKVVDETKPIEAEVAVEVLTKFKRMSGKFMKQKNWRDRSSEYVEVDDDEAVKKIRIDLVRRMDSIKQWQDQKPKSSATKPKKSPQKQDASPKDNSDDEIDSLQEVSTRTLRKKEIPNYANSGAEIVSKTAIEVEAERTARQTLSAKKTPDKVVSKPKLGVYLYENRDRHFYDSSGQVTEQRENDVVISLRDAKYRDALVSYFHELGTVQDKEKNKEAADEVFGMFKEEGGRFFKPNGRGKDADCDQVDDSYALHNIYLDIKRRTDSTWWLEEKVYASLPKKKSSSAKAKTKKATPTQTVIVSLSDPDYREILEVEFKKLGAKTGPDKREVGVAEEVFNRFKRDGAKFCKLENPRNTDSEPIEMDDDEAFKKIRTDIQRRMESAKRWLDGGVNSKSYADTKKASPQKAAPVHKPLQKSRPENSKKTKKRDLPVQMHRSSPPKKKVKTDISRTGSEVLRQSDVATKSHKGATGSSRRSSERFASSMNTNTSNASRARTAPRNRSHHVSENAPKVTICFCDHVIDTEADPSIIQPSESHIRNSESFLPDRFDPNVRPTVPEYSKQIYIPGNEVYARWLNENDLSSYGTWYPGYVYSSKLAPTNVPGSEMPKLLYHVKFHDGAEGKDLHTEDMMMREQYEAWLRGLEKYYALPKFGDAFATRIPRGARVYAQWNDPTDPQAHGSWLQGTVRDANDSGRYHIRFDNGDEDDDMSANHVLLDGVYVQLLAEKMKNNSVPVVSRVSGDARRVNGASSGLNLITNASQLPSPVRQRPNDGSRASASNAIQPVQKPSVLQFSCEIATEDLALSSDEFLLEQLCCNEVLASVKPIARSKTQGIHYGIYVKAKPWRDDSQPEKNDLMQVDEPSKSNAEKQHVPVDELRCKETSA